MIATRRCVDDRSKTAVRRRGSNGYGRSIPKRDAKHTPDRGGIRGKRVLMVGRLRELALYRAEVLRNAGFMVIVPDDVDDALRIMRDAAFDVIVLSYTLPSDTVQSLAEAARQYCPECPVISITDSDAYDRRVIPDAVAVASEGPSSLLAALEKVLRAN